MRMRNAPWKQNKDPKNKNAKRANKDEYYL